MPFKREYYPSDALKILNRSEGRAGISGQLAHAIKRHLRNSATGGQHTGVSKEVFARRWEANPIDEDGNYRVNSGWLGKGDMALLLCQLLNSECGGFGLEALDRGVQRVTVRHYFRDATDFFGNQLTGAVAELRVSANAPTLVYHDNHPNNPLRGQIRSITINPPTYKGVIRMKDVMGAVAVLDNLGGELHLQTFYPLFASSGPACAEYQQGGVATTVFPRADGSPWTVVRIV